jgi:hypothetical protein
MPHHNHFITGDNRIQNMHGPISEKLIVLGIPKNQPITFVVITNVENLKLFF